MKRVAITKQKAAQIHKLAKSMPHLTKIAALMQKAEDEGNLGPEEVKEIASDTKEILLQVVEMVEDIEEGVPAEDVIEEEPPEEIIEEPEIPNVEGKKHTGKDKDEEEIEDEDKERIAKLEKELLNMKYASEVKELSTKYGKLFPESLREAKEKEFYNSKQSIKILEARYKEASKIITDRKSLKLAQIENDGSVSYIEDDDNTILNYKGKF